eukprot:16019188-Heterocapsa_arctica.AAC.1
MFEDPKNKEYVVKLKERVKLAEVRCKTLSIKGDIVDEIMAMGFSWQKVGKMYTGKSHTEKTTIGVGSKFENMCYTRVCCTRLKKLVANKWK